MWIQVTYDCGFIRYLELNDLKSILRERLEANRAIIKSVVASLRLNVDGMKCQCVLDDLL